eukprot:CAMPEP_0113408788 /NCGR_PEP_ID=MMETSP0013_2-20120614/20794_1 /TAXON_ID=2843 ORGANISM="Skeletonema costatum, Strain 1716" /NCGR_SAMPLE_ID=MMETSP0013_2 /ASSEMBLY_ACC=CAM_ASM_000158 /LENGTH=813 /DNA_ID=CAMNT_0000294849 /DNA_START=165 /DNA_END=2606 /DNA_ORIENTATION=+ /assembly_acc=CAM_ASM_000158
MKIILLVNCCLVQLGGSGVFVAGFATSKQTVISPYQSSPSLVTSTTAITSRIHKTHLWYIERGNNNEEEEDADETFLTPKSDSSSGGKKRKMDVTVDVDVKITRGQKETNFQIKQEASQEFGQEDCTDSPVADSSSDEMVSSPLIFEDFVDDTSLSDIVAADQEEESEQDEESSEETPSAPTLLKAIEPTKDKPVKKFISPIQLLKRVPRVEPISMTSVFFVPTSFPGSVGGAADTFSNKKSSPDKTITWKDRMLSQQRRPTAFQATNYLESLGNSADSSSSTDENDASNTSNQQQQKDDPENNNDDMYKNLKAQQGNFRNEQQKSMQEAIYAAMRRTNPKDVVQARIEKREQKRKKMERERLEREYVERKERLDAKKWEDEEALEKEEREGSTDAPASAGRNSSRRGLPILGPFIKSSSPLLIGSTLTFQYSEMTPFQKKALEVSQHYHEEHCTRMNEAAEKAGDEGGIQAAPIVAIIDSFTGEYTETTPGDEQNKKKRFATLSAVEMEPSQDGSGPAVVKLTGVGRVLLYDYFSSKDAGITEEEVELENILKLIQEYDKEYEDMGDDGQEEDDHDDDDFPVVMASFDVILDDSSILVNQSTKHQDATVDRVSSVHAITELYRTANKVYRLHEDRKKIVAGLKAAEERLLLGKERMYENCDIEYEDCDGLGVLSDGVDFLLNEVEAVEITTGTARLSPLAQMENYGFGSFGILSTIPDLTRELALYLESYYSPSHREREEYDAEIASFIAFRCLEEYVDPSDIAAAMLAPSATERLNMAYDLMMRHREELNELVKMISDDLYECGDDCKDLW